MGAAHGCGLTEMSLLDRFVSATVWSQAAIHSLSLAQQSLLKLALAMGNWRKLLWQFGLKCFFLLLFIKCILKVICIENRCFGLEYLQRGSKCRFFTSLFLWFNLLNLNLVFLRDFSHVEQVVIPIYQSVSLGIKFFGTTRLLDYLKLDEVIGGLFNMFELSYLKQLIQLVQPPK